jgi:hypothetical protein
VRLRLSIAFLFVLLLSYASWAQNENRPSRNDSYSKPDPHDPDQQQEINIPAEMRSRLLIERAEDEHRKLVADVKQMNDLSGELSSQYRNKSKLTSDDVKKINAIEKLAKRVLNRALGSEEKPDEPPKCSLGEAIEQLEAAAQKIQTVVTTESRYVVSAAVIASSNEVITLADHIRQLTKREE